jgi:poly(A) polymerase
MSADRLDPQPWMIAPETQALIAALTQDGGQVRFVGGCVRDAIAGRKVKDIDLATPERPETIIGRLKTNGIRAIPTGIDHGTVTAIVGTRHFEITTLRHDVETFGRHARVAFTDDWDEDAARRDFTINAMSLDPDGTLHDPFGGRADLAAGRVRFVGDPETRIREDVLRLLRFFRFHAYFGNTTPDAPSLAACRMLAHLLPTLSGERVAAETLRLMLAPDPAAVVQLMTVERVLAHILPELTNIARLRALVPIEGEGAAPDAVRRLASLLPRDAAAARHVAARLRLSNADRDRLVALAVPARAVHPGLDAPARRRTLYHLGADAFRDLALLAWAGRAAGGDLKPTDAAPWRALVQDAANWTSVALPVRGADVLALGVPAGPRVGLLMKEIERWWEAGDYRADRAACLRQLKKLASAA